MLQLLAGEVGATALEAGGIIRSGADQVSVTLSSSARADETALDARLLRTAFVVVLGSIMSTLDTTIVNVAINDLSRRFDASLAIIQWVATGYLLALATVIPLTG